MTCYNPNIELVNDIVYTKSGLNMAEDMEQNPKSDANQGSLPCCELAENDCFTIPR